MSNEREAFFFALCFPVQHILFGSQSSRDVWRIWSSGCWTASFQGRLRARTMSKDIWRELLGRARDSFVISRGVRNKKSSTKGLPFPPSLCRSAAIGIVLSCKRRILRKPVWITPQHSTRVVWKEENEAGCMFFFGGWRLAEVRAPSRSRPLAPSYVYLCAALDKLQLGDCERFFSLFGRTQWPFLKRSPKKERNGNNLFGFFSFPLKKTKE